MIYIRDVQQAARGPQPGPPSHLVWPLPTLSFFPIMHENPIPTVYVKKRNFSCGPPRCLKLVIWPADKKRCTPLIYIMPFIYANEGDFHETKIKCVRLVWKLARF